MRNAAAGSLMRARTARALPAQRARVRVMRTNDEMMILTGLNRAALEEGSGVGEA